ncbi:MAG: heme exporter protein CcmB [Acidobacteria bacterium]|nr:heme exporter protein CcmB [Acidobacteriota bacterium]
MSRPGDREGTPGPGPWLHQALAVAGKDLRVEWRSRGRLVTTLFFALVVAVLFQFVLEPGPRLREAAPAALWTSWLFAGLMQLGATFDRERRDGCLAGLCLAPVSGSAVFAGKWLSGMALLFSVELLSLPVFLAFFGLESRGGVAALLLCVVAADAGFVAAGVLCAALTTGGGSRDLLLPVLVFPLAVPGVLAGARALDAVFRGPVGPAFWGAVKLAAGFDLLFLLAGAVLFRHILEAGE